MILKKLRLKNFRRHKDLTVEFDKSLNVIVGRNDIGKSTILEALDIFFGEGGKDTTPIEIDDCNTSITDKKIEISIIFEVTPNTELVIDSSAPTTLEQESLLNKDGVLEVVKTWDCTTKSKPKLATFIKANYYEDIEKPLVCLTIDNLKKLLKESNIEDKCDDKKICSKIRKIIYENIDGNNKSERLISVDKKDYARAIWGSLKKELPVFFLFKADRENRDSDDDVQKTLKVVTKQVTEEDSLKKDLEAIVERVREAIQERADATRKKLHEISPSIAKGISPNIGTKTLDSLFSYDFEGDDGIPINKRGSGIRRLILLSHFRAEAERKNTSDKNIIYAIEEPETSQHPNHQRMLVEALKEIGDKPNHQVIITTHTPEIAKLCSEKQLIHLKEAENKVVEIRRCGHLQV